MGTQVVRIPRLMTKSLVLPDIKSHGATNDCIIQYFSLANGSSRRCY
jgi:hypothetical protein